MNKLDNLPDSLNTAPLETIAKENIIKYLSPPNLPEWVSSSLTELIDKKNWNELNYRFNNQLSFGTGGMRGRTISQNLTEAEKGNSTNKLSTNLEILFALYDFHAHTVGATI